MKSKFEDILDSTVFRNAKDVDTAMEYLASIDLSQSHEDIRKLIDSAIQEWNYFAEHSLGRIE